MTDTLIDATGITKCFRRGGRAIVAIPPTDLTLSTNELVAVVGASRSGKTTLVNLLAGWETPDAGTIAWLGAGAVPPGWCDVAVIPQSFALLDELTVAENIALPRRLDPAARPLLALGAVLDALDLTALADRGTGEISVGERQRVMVARAVCTEARVILADDPVAHQDDRRARAVLQLLVDAVERGAGCVIATRNPSVAAVAHRLLRLDAAAPSPPAG